VASTVKTVSFDVAISPCAKWHQQARIVKRELGLWLVKTLSFLRLISLKALKTRERANELAKCPTRQDFPRALRRKCAAMS
jgi:hypothetical protein